MSKHKKTTTAIIGGGLTGLTLAALLEQSGEDYLLIEGQGEFGGLAKGQLEQGVWLDHGLKSIPAGDEISSNPLVKLKRDLDLRFQIESFTETPQTFDKRGLSPFVGFGESKVRSLIEELSYYLISPRLLISGGWNNLTEALLAKIPDSKRITRSFVTRLEVEEGRVCDILINGEDHLNVKNVVFTISPELLRGLLPNNVLSPKLSLKIAKTTPWTSLSLDIATAKKTTDAKNIFIFQDNADENFYVLGQFVSNADPSRNVADLQISSWLSFIDAENALDDEYVSKALKMMKKNIKKAFPALIEQNSWERILVLPSSVAQFNELPLEKSGSLTGFKNLYLAGAQIGGAERNIVNALNSAIGLAPTLVKNTLRDQELLAPEAQIQL